MTLQPRYQSPSKLPPTESSNKIVRIIEERYQIMNIVLSNDGFSEAVHVCWDNTLKEVLMAKVTSKQAIVEQVKQSSQRLKLLEYYTSNLKNEVALLEKLDHSNVIKLRDCIETSENVYQFYQYCAKGSIQTLVAKQKKLSYEMVLPYWRQLLRVICYLHAQGIVHRAIEPKNIYIDEKNRVKLINFKNAYNLNEYRPADETMFEKSVFMAPEMFFSPKITQKSDVWSLGVTLYYMLYGCSPWPNTREHDWHKRLISSVVFPPDVEVPQKLKKSIQKMLIYDCQLRVSMKQLQQQFGV